MLTTRSTPLILAGMALERYVAICFPLHHSRVCTASRTLLLIGCILLLAITPPASDLLIAVVHEPPAFFHSSIFCDHPLLFRHHSIYYKNCVIDGVYLFLVAVALLYTYCKIMLTAHAASVGWASVRRARNTVLLHGLQVGPASASGRLALAAPAEPPGLLLQLLLCMLALVVPSLQAALISHFPRLGLEIRYVFFLVVYVIPRFTSPVVYGFRDEQFRKYWSRYLACCGQARLGPRKVNR